MERQIVIVGGGASGTLLATQLLRQGQRRRTTVRVVERARSVGLGLAYQTTDPAHRLNVPAGRMSAFPDDPDHLLRWAQRRDRSVDGWTYLPRHCFGRYLHDVLDDAVDTAGETWLDLVRGAADRVTPVDERTGAGLLHLTDGRCLPFDHLVLATGHAGPTPLPATDAARQTGDVVDDPWAPGAIERVARVHAANRQPIVLVGTGLTMVDVALSLARRAPGATLTAVSRHGLVPRSHPRHRRARRPDAVTFDEPPSARSMLRCVREAVDKAMLDGDDWTGVIDDLRPLTTPLWRSLPSAERRRFLRHVGRRWEVVRHRMAPDVGDEVAHLQTTGALALRAGRVREIRQGRGSLEVELTHAGHTRVVRTSAVVNCTGPCSDVTRTRSPFLRTLLDQGLVRPDPLGLGLEVDATGALLDGEGRPSPGRHAIGPLRKGELFESTAIPELRVQAAELATTLLSGAP